VAGEGDRGKTRIAVVSVLATAAVGIAGAATTLLVSRDQRATARADRIYERRAAAYVQAIDTLEGHLKVLNNLDPPLSQAEGFELIDLHVNDETDVARARARVVAFGSNDAIAAFDRVGALDKEAFAWVYGETPGSTEHEVWRLRTGQAIENLRVGLRKFERRLNRELTS
jgi:hypothetical protein